MGAEIQTPEATVLANYIHPAESGLAALEPSIVRNPNGEIARVAIRSDRQYEAGEEALRLGRGKRKGFIVFFKEKPSRPKEECLPGEGALYYARMAYEGFNDLFNAFDKRLARLFGTAKEGGLIEIGMGEYRAEVERKAKEEAEAKAKAERERLEAQAAEERRKAAEERKKAEAAAEAERKRQAAITEEERKRAVKAAEEKAAREKAELERKLESMRKEAASKAERARVEREAREVAERIAQEQKARQEAAEREAKAKQEQADREAEEARLLAQEQAQEREDMARQAEVASRNVVAVVEREAPKIKGYSITKVWKGRITDMGKLVKAIAAGQCPLTVIEQNDTGCNNLAKAFGGCNPPPGMEFYEEEQTRMGGKKKG